MADDQSSKKQDLLIPAGPSRSDHGTPILRVSENGISAGMLRIQEPGKDLEPTPGGELAVIRKLPNGMYVTDARESKPSKGSKGSKVGWTPSYDSNYDSIFGKKTEGLA